MRLLLDTSVALWIATERRAVPEAARHVIDGAAAVLVIAASIWEIAIKVRLGKLDVDLDALIHDFATS